MPARSAVKSPYPVTLLIPFGDSESVTVVFNRNGMTQNWANRVQEGIDAGDLLVSARALEEILIEWDIFEEDGTPTPITVDVLADLPLPFLKTLNDAIGEAGLPGSEEGNDSRTISSIPLSVSSSMPVSPPNGPVPSTRPESSVAQPTS